ncbi:MAG: EF-P lysine aminoacylase EpmA [Patescibacteria group bacterium]
MERLSKIAKERVIINSAIREFFNSRGYLEVETPILVISPGSEPNLAPVKAVLKDFSGREYNASLITSPEYSMKKLLGMGFEKIFTITKVFRNCEEFGGNHNPEFSMLEWYCQGADYHACMQETEELVKSVLNVFGVRSLPVTFARKRMQDLFLEYAYIDLDDPIPTLGKGGLGRGLDDTQSDAFYRIFLEKIESHLGKDPIFVYDYPYYQAALAQLTSDGKYAQRFELYINGVELCNGFTELTDTDEQRKRFEQEIHERMNQGKQIFPIDEELLRLLPLIKNPTYGNALGIDRLHMVATGCNSIEDVLLFPINKLLK